MEKSAERVEIVLCMGSSCHANGNNITHQIIQEYLEKVNLVGKVDFKGELCLRNCKNGPNLRVGTKLFSDIDSTSAITILKEYFTENGLFK